MTKVFLFLSALYLLPATPVISAFLLWVCFFKKFREV